MRTMTTRRNMAKMSRVHRGVVVVNNNSNNINSCNNRSCITCVNNDLRTLRVCCVRGEMDPEDTIPR